MKAEALYIQQIVGQTSDKKDIIELFPSAANPAVVHSYTYTGKRMGGAPTLTATIYTDKPLHWKKEEFVEFNGERFFATYTPNGTKDNSSRMYKHEITFTSRRELLDNTLFFDVVVDDVDTQDKDRYRSNQTKFTFGGDIYEFVARINSSMAYCGLYRPNDTDKGYYVVVDEGYGTDEVKEVSFEDQYLTDVLQLINTTYELTYYWVGNVCHVGKVQNDLTDKPVKYGRNNELVSVAKENANYKIVDMITGYGSSDNIPYYYPNDDEFGEAEFETENFDKSLVTNIDLSKIFKWNPNIYNDVLTLCKTSQTEYNADIIGVSPYLTKISGGLRSDDMTQYPSDYPKLQNSIDGVKFTSHLGRVSYSYNPGFGGSATAAAKIWNFQAYIIAEVDGMPTEGSIDFSKFAFSAKEVGSNLGFKFSYVYKYYVGENMTKEDVKKILNDTNLSVSGFGRRPEGMTDYSESSDKIAPIVRNVKHAILIECSISVSNTGVVGDKYVNAEVVAEPSGVVNYVFKPKSQYYWQYGTNTEGYEDCGIEINNLTSIPVKSLEFAFDGNKWNGSEEDDTDASKLHITDRIWLDPSQNLMPSIYRASGGAERFYYAKNGTHLLPDGSGKYYEFANLYKEGNPHQGSVTFDDIKPTINGIRNDVIQSDGLGQLFGEIADVAFDSNDSDVKDENGTFEHQYFYLKLHKFSGEFGFDLFKHVLASEPAKVNLIKSNGCPACSFTIYATPSADKSKEYNCVSVDENGNLKRVNEEKNDYIFANDSDAYDDKLNQDSTQKELWIAVQKEDSTLGIVMPNASAGFKPQKGDLFVLTGIKPPKVLVTAAEKRLDDALIKYMSENNEDQFNYSIKFSRIFLQENPDFAKKLNENAKLSIHVDGEVDTEGNEITHDVFVSDYSVKVENDILAEVEVSLVNSLEVSQSEIKQMIDSVKGETIKQLGNLTGGSNNNFNANITDKLYLSKLNDDTAQGLITFLQGFHLGSDGRYYCDANGKAVLSGVILDLLQSADYDDAAQTGFGFYRRKDGKYGLNITDLSIWGKAIFNNLTIRELSYVGGNIVFSPSAGKIFEVREVRDDKDVLTGWKCYLLADDGTTATTNMWEVDDQVKCETFNIAPGVYENVSNKYYWRRVTEVSTENEVITDGNGNVLYDGKKYAWIVISASDMAINSDVPAAGDTIVLEGNRTKTDRMNFVIKETWGDDAPREVGYTGIDSYNLDGHIVYEISPKKVRFYTQYYEQVTVSGEVIKTINDRGDWKQGGTYYYYDQVSHNGTLWLCIAPEGKDVTSEPARGNEQWRAMTAILDVTLSIQRSLGEWIDKGETDHITCSVIRGFEDITDQVTSWEITRDSGDATNDAAWNNKPKAKNFIGEIDISWTDDEDDIGDDISCIFTITAYGGNKVKLAQGTISV